MLLKRDTSLVQVQKVDENNNEIKYITQYLPKRG